MPLYGSQPPTGYAMTATAWVNTGALLNRMNFAVSLVEGGRIEPQSARGNTQAPASASAQGSRRQGPGRGANPNRQTSAGPLHVDIAGLAPDTGEASRERVIAALLGGEVADSTRQTLARADTPKQLIALALGSPEFQRR
jgi:uncharacterized protein (DUF1800 family)